MISALLALSGDAFAKLSLRPSLHDYVRTSWTQHDGVPLSKVNSIAQTTDGYLWFTTAYDGLLRFDGVRFVPHSSFCGQARSDGAGGLYLLCDYQMYHRDSLGRTVPVQQSLMPSTLRPSMRFFVDRQRRLWLWGRSLGYIRPDGSEGPEIPGTERPKNAQYCAFAEDSDGNIWFGTKDGLIRVQDNVAQQVLTGQVLAVTPSFSGGVYALRSDSIVHVGAGPVHALVHFSPDLSPSSNEIMTETSAGVWFGTANRGVALVHNGSIEFFGRQEGLTADRVNFVFRDSEGSVWIGTTLGLERFREPLAYVMSGDDGIPPGMPSFLYRDSRNGLWLGTYEKTVRIDQESGRKQTFDFHYLCIGEDRSGRIWLATANDLGYLQDGRFVAVRDSAGARIPNVNALRADAEGGLWALSSAKGLYKVIGSRAELRISLSRSYRLLLSTLYGIWMDLDGSKLLQQVDGRQNIFGTESGLTGDDINAIQEYDGSIWVGARQGLSRWRHGKWTTWGVKEGLPGRGNIYEITSDANGRFWMMADGGILAMNRLQLDQTPDGEPRALTYLRIGSMDRISPHTGGMVASPRVTKDADGRLFFATFDSFAVVDPSRINQQSFAPPIVLETVLVNRRPVAPGASSKFVEPEDVQFEYTSLSLRNPENVRFRYRLEGRDNDWIEAGSQRRASYGALKPGSYRFRVIGSGSEGVWNNTGSSYDFRIVSPFYKTYPFLAAVALTIATFVWLLYRYRMQLATERVRLRMEAQADERIRIAQEMHDSLLQAIHSVSLTVFAAKERMDRVPSESHQLLDRALAILGDSTDQARKMLTSLRAASPAREPLAARLEALAAQEAALYPEPPRVSVEVSGNPRNLRDAIDRDVYLIASEALKNAFHHSQARHITVSLQFGADFRLKVADDGVGISREIRQTGVEEHFGLGGMRERAERLSGAVTIECPEAGGTAVQLSLPGGSSYAPYPITRSGNAR